MQIKDLLELNNIDYYKSSKSIDTLGQLTGKYYVWSADPLNNRIRIAKTKKDCGVKGKYIGWILLSDLEIKEEIKEIVEEKPCEIEEEIAKPDKSEYKYKEYINKDNSLTSICWKYYGNYDNISKILHENDYKDILLNEGAEILLKDAPIITKSQKYAKTFIMVCGTPHSARLTWISKFIKSYQLENATAVISRSNSNKKIAKNNCATVDEQQEGYKQFLKDVKCIPDKDIIIFEDEFISMFNRQDVINCWEYKSNINFICVYLNLPLNQKIAQTLTECNITLENTGFVKRIVNNYKTEDISTNTEFANFDFKSSKVFIIDNLDSIETIFNYLKTLE